MTNNSFPSSPLKVLITTDFYAPVVNGVVTSVLTLKAQLEELGCDVRVLTLAEGMRSSFSDGIYRLASLNASVFYDHARISVLPNKNIRREIEAWHPDVIHSQCEFSTFLWARAIAKKLNIPIVHTYHTIYEDYTHYYSPSKTMGKKMITAFSKKFCTQVDAVITPTEKVQRLLRGYGVSQPIHVIPTGLDLTHFRPAETEAEIARSAQIREELEIPADHQVLVSVCRLAKEKNLDEVLLNLAEAKPEKATFVMIGDGPYRPELEALVDELGIREMVRFAGFRSPKEIPEFYRMADIFLSASLSETQGLTFIEAMACGLPLLCRQDDSLAGVIIEGTTGFEYTNAKEFAEALDFLLSDPDHAKWIGSRGQAHAATKFSATAFGDAVIDSYYQVMNSKQGRFKGPNLKFIANFEDANDQLKQTAA